MNTVTQKTITGKVQEVTEQNDYLVKFVIKTIKEGEAAWINVNSSDWQAWSLREGDEVSLRGQITSTVWKSPFLNEELETLEMETREIMFA